MNFMKKTSLYIFGLLSAVLFLPVLVMAQTAVNSEISIDKDGKITAKNIKVTMVPEPGKSRFFYTRAIWEDVFIRMTVITDERTVVSKNQGGEATVFDISEGDILNIEGYLPNSASALNIQAIKITNTSLNKEDKDISGTITEASNPYSSFMIVTKNKNAIKVNVNSGTAITKGARTVSPGELSLGDKVLSVKGVFDYKNYSIEASQIEVFQDPKVFAPRNFQGTLKSISGVSLPATMVVEVGGKSYTVYLSEKTIVMNKAKGNTGLTRFVQGDTVRFYGAVRKTNLSEVDAEVARNLNF